MPNNLYMCACVLHVRVFVYWHLCLTFLSCSLRGCIACFVIFICLCRNTDIIAVYTSRCRVHPSFTHTHNTHINIHMLLHVFECVCMCVCVCASARVCECVSKVHLRVPACVDVWVYVSVFVAKARAVCCVCAVCVLCVYICEVSVLRVCCVV